MNYPMHLKKSLLIGLVIVKQTLALKSYRMYAKINVNFQKRMANEKNT